MHLAGKGELGFEDLVVLVLLWLVCDTRVKRWVSISSSHYWCVYDCIQNMQPPRLRNVPESNAPWNHTQDLFVSGTENDFYGKHPAVIPKY